MSKLPRYLLLFLFANWLLSCTGQTPPPSKAQRSVKQFVSDQALQHAGVSFMALDLASGKTMAQYHPDQSLAPASTLKLLTTATALELLGPDFRFTTEIAHDGKLLSSGRLEGNLYIVGGGDPTLASKYFPDQKDLMDQWTKAIQAYPIRNIQGQVSLIEKYIDSQLPRTWIWEDIANYYGATAQSLSYRDNTYTIFFQSGPAGTPTQIVKIEPELDEIVFQNHVVSSSVNKDEAYIFGGPESPKRIIRGSIPQNRKSFKVKGALPYPGKVLQNDLQTSLQQNGIAILEKSIKMDSTSTSLTTIYKHQSPKLSEIVYYTNQKSVNLFAEHLLYQLGIQALRKGDQEHGLQALKEYWQNQKIDISGAFLYDGSGLSRFNAISAGLLTQVLHHMNSSPNRLAFKNSLPIAGRSGTLKHFGKGSVLVDKLMAKTGSMQGVRSYAGYLTNHKGKKIAFALIINNYNGSSSALSEKVKQLLIKIYYS